MWMPGARHVALADTAVFLGPAPATDSYLNSEAIHRSCPTQTGADAIHPGYGFLAENADFARACAEAGLIFIGPTPEAIAAMGNKRAARELVAAAGVPVLPGYDGAEQGNEHFHAAAAEIGYPVMVKAAAGGGGKGMRLVTSPDELDDALAAARREASRRLALTNCCWKRRWSGRATLKCRFWRPAGADHPPGRAGMFYSAPPPEGDRRSAGPGSER
jgi:acetyl/propionyl-CoA carboxylase alpha subunit